jgi:hypothetical protein
MRRPRFLSAAFAALLCGMAVVCGGCSLFPDRTPGKVLTSINAHAYYELRYERTCVKVKGPATCPEAQAALNEWKADAQLASAALTRGGKLPLQLAQLKADEAKTKRLLK